MTKHYEKFLGTLEGNMKRHFFRTLQAIEKDEFSGYDVKRLSGGDNLYRIRIGKRRIIFRKGFTGNKVLKIESRGDVYKGL